MPMRSFRPASSAAALLALAAGLGVSGAGAAEPGEQPVTVDTQAAVAVTIYNEDLALVKDRRIVRLDAGANRLAFIDVSAQIRPETALLTSDGDTVSVIEQNFDFDLLTPEKLLEKSVGSIVRVITVNPATGAETVEEARVLSVADGAVVLEIGDRVETNPPGRIVFSGVPANLRARPTLVLDVESSAAGEQPVELSYLTGGLGWKADYVAELSADESQLDLNGWVTLTNTSGTSYGNAQLQLVAGDVHRVREAMPLMARGDVRMEMAAPAPMMQEEAAFEYHLYTLQRPTTLAENQTKQVALLSGAGVPVGKEYRFEYIGAAYDYVLPQARDRVNATVRVAFDNSEAAHLGLPLPKGAIRVYKKDSRGQVIFVGEDAIEHTPKGEKVELTLGQAFDVTARPKQTDFERLSDTSFESAFEIEIRNAKPEPITATVVERLPGEWRILEESQPHRKESAGEAAWQIQVPAEGSATLTYRVRIQY